MYSRKLALTLAKQYRTCPPPVVRDDPSQRLEYERHLAICPYCSMQKKEEHEAWIALSRELENLFEGEKEHEQVEKVNPGQFRFLRKDLSRWREGLFYNPPMVLVLENTSVISDDLLVSQACHDISLAGPGDLILRDHQTPVGDLFLESWNIYTLKAADLGKNLGCVPPEIINAVKSLEKEPDAYPDWAILPRPFTVNDPRIYFRELEVEVGYTFAVRSVSGLMEEAEAPRLRLAYTSAKAVRDAVHKIVPGTRWQREPMTREEALALAELPPENLLLAANDKAAERTSANLIRIEAGKVKSIEPLPMEIYGQSGTLTISSRIFELPEDLNNTYLISFLDLEGSNPRSPVRHEWKEETGDFMIEFQSQEDAKWSLKMAVLFEPAKQ